MIFDQYLKEAFIFIAIVSGVPLVACSLTGLFVSILQAATQIQEQTIAFLVKLVTLALVIFLLGTFGFNFMLEFIQKLLGDISLMGN